MKLPEGDNAHLPEGPLPPEPGPAAHSLLAQPLIAAIAASGMPMLLTDPGRPENPIVFANAAFVALCGYAHEEIVGSNCRFLQGPDSDPETVALIRQAVEASKEISTTLVNYRKDGTWFWNALYISPIRDADGRVHYFFACQLDVSQWHGEAASTRLQAEHLATGAALRRWREVDRLASLAEGNLARRQIAHSKGLDTPLFAADRRLATELRALATRTRDEAFGLLERSTSKGHAKPFAGPPT